MVRENQNLGMLTLDLKQWSSQTTVVLNHKTDTLTCLEGSYFMIVIETNHLMTLQQNITKPETTLVNQHYQSHQGIAGHQKK